jgi:hypothetical protein
MYFVVMLRVNLIVILMTYVRYLYSINCPTVICLPSMCYLLYLYKKPPLPDFPATACIHVTFIYWALHGRQSSLSLCLSHFLHMGRRCTHLFGLDDKPFLPAVKSTRVEERQRNGLSCSAFNSSTQLLSHYTFHLLHYLNLATNAG